MVLSLPSTESQVLLIPPRKAEVEGELGVDEFTVQAAHFFLGLFQYGVPHFPQRSGGHLRGAKVCPHRSHRHTVIVFFSMLMLHYSCYRTPE